MSQTLVQKIAAAAALAFALLFGALGLSSEPAMAECLPCGVDVDSLDVDLDGDNDEREKHNWKRAAGRP